MDKATENDAVIEVIEVLVHCYLYIRKIYPNGIFKKSIKYGSPVYTSIYPPLNAYIKDILNGARHLNKTKRLHKLEIQLYKDDEDESTRKLITLETFVLDDIAKQYFDIENDEYLFDFEEVCRVGLLELSEKAKNLGPLPVGTKFRICVQTTQSAFVKMCNESKLQDPPWLQDIALGIQQEKTKSSILPVARISNIIMQIINHR